jgi:ribosomal protein S18 acetylase RimI-like enzyme
VTERSAGARITVRPLSRADAPALLRLWNHSARHDPCNAPLLEEKIWHDPDHDPDMALVCASADRLLGFVVAVSRQARASAKPAGYIKLLAVDPKFQRGGVGSRLLLAAEQALARTGARSVRLGESAPNYLVPGVDLRYAPALAFFRRQGYRPVAQASNLRVTLVGRSFDATEDRLRLQNAGIWIRRARANDHADLARLLDEFGGGWAAEVERSLAHDPPLVHVAEQGGVLVGFSASEGNNVGTGWFGPMGTTEQARGLGIGKVLLYRCLADLAALGFREAIIPWVGPVEFYARHASAEVDRRFQRFEKEIEA